MSSRFKALGQTLSLVYKIVFTLATGALLVALITACLHFRTVQVGIRDAEQLLAQGQLPEADAMASRLEPWARCFPGRFRLCASVRVRCLARSNQPEAAAQLAEALRLHVDVPVPVGSAREFGHDPLVWLQKTALFLVSDTLDALFPVVRLSDWAGYETLLNELVAKRDVEGVNALTANLLARFPRSQIASLANYSQGELKPEPPPRPAQPAPRPRPSTRAPAATPNDDTEPGSSNRTAGAESATPDTPPPPPASWGIVTNPAAMALNPQTGEPIRPLKVGDVLVIERTRTFDESAAFTGTLVLNNRNVPDLAFYGSDLEIRPGAFESVPPDQVALLSRLAEIQSEESVLQPKLARELATLSPEETAYRQAKGKMDAFQKEAEGLNAKLGKSTGAARMSVLEKLRSMKYQEQNLLRDLQARKEAADLTTRKAGHLSVEPQLTALLQEKKAILAKLAEFAP